MSGVGDVGAIIGLISGTIEIVKSTKYVYSAFQNSKGQPKQFRSIAAKFPLVLEILQNAEEKAQPTKLDDAARNEAENNIKACKEKVDALNQIFTKVLRKDDDKWLDRYKKAVVALLMGTATTTQIEKLQEAIQEMLDMSSSIPDDGKSITQHHTGSGHNIASTVTNNNIGEGSYTNSNTGKGPQLNNNGPGNFYFNNFSGSQNSTTLLQSLAFPEMDLHRKDIIEAVKHTCEWLCNEPDYKNWRARSQRLLWIVGIPGSGKSTIMKYIYHQDMFQLPRMELNEGTRHPSQQAPKKPIVASFFCHGTGDIIQKNRVGLFRSLLHQILQQIPELPPEVTSYFVKRCNLEVKPGENLEWHEHDLEEMLQTSISHIAKEYPHEYVLRIYVDALDEFDSNEPRDLAEYFQSLTSLDRLGIDLNICISCRDYPFIANGGLKISIGNKNHRDISLYVRNKLAGIKREGYEARKLINWIIENASGIFQWAVIVAEKARDFNEYIESPKRILEKLIDLPQGLDKLYDKSFQTMDVTRRLQSLRLLSWICFARRPLSVKELYDVMTFEPYISTLRKSVDYKSSPREMAKMIQNHSCNLAVINKHKGYRIVQLRHQSAYDYLVSSGLKYFNDNNPISSSLAFSLVGCVHLRLLKSCINYLSTKEVIEGFNAAGALQEDTSTNFTGKDFDNDHPFCRYAAFNWAYHAKLVEDENPDQETLLQLYHQFVNSPFEESSMAAAMVQHRETGMKLLHIASQYGLFKLVELILKFENYSIYSEQRSAVKKVQAKLFQRTLKRVDVDIRTRTGLTPLILAIRGQHEKVVALLVNDHNADVNIVGQGLDNAALVSAVKSGHKGIVALLLQRTNIDINVKDYSLKSALIWAAGEGHKEISEMLLRHKSNIDVNAMNVWCATALGSAINGRHEGTATLLLWHRKINVNALSESGTAPLITTMERRQDGMELLKHSHIDVNTTDESDTTPLINAIQMGQERIVELLLRHSKIDVKARGRSGTTALMTAIRMKKESMVALLLRDSKIEVNAVDEKPTDSVKNRHRGMTELLQKYSKITVITANGPRTITVKKGDERLGIQLIQMMFRGPTPLMAAVKSGQERIVALLLQHHETDPNAGNGLFNEPPLYQAIKNHQKAIATLLLQHIEIDVNKQHDGAGETPLSIAAEYDYKEMVILLLSKADIDISAGPSYKSPLTIAIEEQNWIIVDLLLEERSRMSDADKHVAQALEKLPFNERKKSKAIKQRQAQDKARRDMEHHDDIRKTWETQLSRP